jgi:hypothetical protein
MLHPKVLATWRGSPLPLHEFDEWPPLELAHNKWPGKAVPVFASSFLSVYVIADSIDTLGLWVTPTTPLIA